MSAIPVSEKPASHSLPTFLAPVSPLVNAYSRFSQWRTALDLPNPGTAENLQKEVKSAWQLLRPLSRPILNCHRCCRHTFDELLL